MKKIIIKDIIYIIKDVYEYCNGNYKISLSPEVIRKIKKSSSLIAKKANSDKSIYGINTGFGKLSQIHIESKDLVDLQNNLLISHAVGVGDACPKIIVRIMLLLKIISFAKGHSGISIEVVNFLIKLFNNNYLPFVPEKGSVGASGDLAPLAHLSLPILGLGEIFVNGEYVKSIKALKKIKLKPLELGPKEGLALINGTQFSTAYGVYCLMKINDLLKISDIAGAMTIEAIKGSKKPFLKYVNDLKPYNGQRDVSKNFITLLSNSEIMKSHNDCDRVQDIYSLRCIPQVHGSSRDLIYFGNNQINNELNSVSDNPLVFSDREEIVSAGHFHAEAVGHALDIAGISLASLSNISERRIFSLLSGDYGLPKFLIDNAGLNSGFMMLQVTAAALASENKILANPSSTDSIPTCSNQEDYVSMAPYSGRKLLSLFNNFQAIIGIELLTACQGIDFRNGLKPAEKLNIIHKLIRTKVAFLDKDRYMKNDLDIIIELINNKTILKTISKDIDLL